MSGVPGLATARVPVIILNWNGWQDTFLCLESLKCCPDATSVWLVDNGSTEDHTAAAATLFPGLRSLRWDDNYGFAGGYNRALRMACSEGYTFAYLLNNDCRVRPGFLSAVVEPALREDRLAAVGSCMVFAEDTAWAIFDGEYHLIGEQPLEPFDLRYVPHVNGAGMLVRLQTLAELGLFDERFFCYGEEMAWCQHAVAAGWRVAVCGQSVVVHRRQGSDVNHNAAYYRTRNYFLFVEDFRWPRRSVWTVLLCARAAGAVLDAFRSGEIDKAEATAAAVRDAFLGRFGRRRSGPARWVARVLLAWGWVRALMPGRRFRRERPPF
ncbi:MAG TPA: glycosyltransferase family 2 protein [Vicinamibacteria bacterium]|nr:glycosyltransferase family 2 protein [Vicinamibacteria bacterium]